MAQLSHSAKVMAPLGKSISERMKMPAGSANSKEGEGAYIHTAAPRGSCAGGHRYFLKEFQPTGLTPHWTRGKARKEEAAETK